MSRDRRSWRVGGDSVELDRTASGWTARVRRRSWGGVPLEVDRRFVDEAGAIAWCEKMARVLIRDREDDLAD